MKKLILLTTFFAFLSGTVAVNAADGGHYPVKVCHKDRMMITVDKAALKAHLAHGDKVGPCKVKPPSPSPIPTP